MNILNELPNSLGAHIPLKEVILQAGIATRAKTICEKYGRVLVICDENTKDFVNTGGDKIILPGDQKAELPVARALAHNDCDYFVAVGSGSINDIVKYAAFEAQRPYIVFGTAPSMNGYCSPNASLLDAGYKKSFAANAPESVYLDTEILSAAPKRLINSGIGDSICRATVQADILLSKQVKNTADYVDLFMLLKKNEDRIFDDIEALARTLIWGGIAMLIAGNSAPASQGEHMISHYMELMQADAKASFHGEQIAVTTLIMAELQREYLEHNDYVYPREINEERIIEHFGREFGAYCLEQTRKKYENLREVKIDKKAIEKVLLDSEALRQKLQAIGAPTTPQDIGWDLTIYNNAIAYAKYTRDRFTFLDLA